MKSVNIHDAKTHFSRLVDEVSAGESILIAKAGRAVAKLVPLDAVPADEKSRTGFLKRMAFPNDFDRIAQQELAELFRGGE